MYGLEVDLRFILVFLVHKGSVYLTILRGALVFPQNSHLLVPKNMSKRFNVSQTRNFKK